MYALREEGNITAAPLLLPLANFYPRPPRGGRPAKGDTKGIVRLFLSTPSVRRATRRAFSNPDYLYISIHALREEGDPYEYRIFHTKLVFLSTPSARRATTLLRLRKSILPISIHALREEGDFFAFVVPGIHA